MNNSGKGYGYQGKSKDEIFSDKFRKPHLTLEKNRAKVTLELKKDLITDG